jgi:hypothetical protein
MLKCEPARELLVVLASRMSATVSSYDPPQLVTLLSAHAGLAAHFPPAAAAALDAAAVVRHQRSLIVRLVALNAPKMPRNVSLTSLRNVRIC